VKAIIRRIKNKMTHLKRQKIENFWPIPRKGTKYLTVAAHSKNDSIPLVVVMREILGLVNNKKELQKLINEKKVVVNGKVIRDVKYPISLFDNISFPGIKKHYKAILKAKRYGFEEINEKQAQNKTYRVKDKKELKGKKTQINLNNGKNILSADKVKVGDFVVLNLKENKITKTISLEKGIDVVVIKGKHMGVQGKVKEISEEGQNKIALVSNDNEDIKVNVENLFAA